MRFSPGFISTFANATVAYTDKASTNVSSNATFNSFGIGTAAANRYVVIAIASYTGTPSAVTVGGISASLVKQQVNNDMTAQLWIAAVPTGTSATVMVSRPGGSAYINIIGWALTNLVNGGTASSTASVTASGSAMTLATVPAGSVVIAAAGSQQGGSQTVSWTNANKDTDNNTNICQGGASIAKATSADGLQVTGTISGSPGSNNPVAVSAAFR